MRASCQSTVPRFVNKYDVVWVVIWTTRGYCILIVEQAPSGIDEGSYSINSTMKNYFFALLGY